jgi:hypothetical protein
MPACEVYPHSENWGTYGFTYLAQEEAKARQKFAALVEKFGERNL